MCSHCNDCNCSLRLYSLTINAAQINLFTD